MTQNEAFDFVRRLAFGLQRARSASSEGIENIIPQYDFNGKAIDPDFTRRVLEDLIPWLHGEKGEAFLAGVQKVADRGTVTGMEFFNFMTVIHRLNPVIAMMAGTFADCIFPEPNPSQIMEIGL